MLLVGVYGVDATGVSTCGRFLYRFERPGDLPGKVAPLERSNESVVVPLFDESRVVVVVLAVEEDSGRGLQTLYAELERGEAIVAWDEQSSGVAPVHLSELTAGALAPEVAHRIHLVFEDRDPSRDLRGDDWIGAGLVWAPLEHGQGRHRLHFVAPDGRNDWTAELELTIRRA